MTSTGIGGHTSHGGRTRRPRSPTCSSLWSWNAGCEADHSAVRAYAAHPGYAATNLQGRTGNRIGDRLVMVANKVIAQSEEMGALPILFAATQELPGASYVGPDRLTGRRGHPTLVGRSAEASDVDLAKKLWAASEELTGVTYPAKLGPSAA